MKVFTYRYLWQLKDSSQVNFKIVSDVPEGLLNFEKQLLVLPGIVKCAKEYLHEYDCSLIGKFDSLLGGESNETE